MGSYPSPLEQTPATNQVGDGVMCEWSLAIGVARRDSHATHIFVLCMDGTIGRLPVARVAPPVWIRLFCGSMTSALQHFDAHNLHEISQQASGGMKRFLRARWALDIFAMRRRPMRNICGVPALGIDINSYHATIQIISHSLGCINH